MNYQEFKNKWNEFNRTGYGFLKLSIDHPLVFQVGYCNSVNKALIVMDVQKIENIPCSNAVRALSRELTNGKWSLELQLLQEEFEEEFLSLGWDIITYSREAKNPLNALISRYLSWQKLLQYANKNTMSFSRQKGLLGELLFLRDSMKEQSKEDVVKAWVGPDGADQDFVFYSTWNEIKTVALAAETVKISSLEQLRQEKQGILSVYVLEKTNPGMEHISLPCLVKEIRNDMASEQYLLDLFNLKLFKYGYRDKDEDEYIKNYFRFIERREYVVNDEFPRLTRNNVAPEIVSGMYTLSLSAIEKFRRN